VRSTVNTARLAGAGSFKTNHHFDCSAEKTSQKRAASVITPGTRHGRSRRRGVISATRKFPLQISVKVTKSAGVPINLIKIASRALHRR
jgi:hypothetical protein